MVRYRIRLTVLQALNYLYDEGHSLVLSYLHVAPNLEDHGVAILAQPTEGKLQVYSRR